MLLLMTAASCVPDNDPVCAWCTSLAPLLAPELYR